MKTELFENTLQTADQRADFIIHPSNQSIPPQYVDTTFAMGVLLLGKYV